MGIIIAIVFVIILIGFFTNYKSNKVYRGVANKIISIIFIGLFSFACLFGYFLHQAGEDDRKRIRQEKADREKERLEAERKAIAQAEETQKWIKSEKPSLTTKL